MHVTSNPYLNHGLNLAARLGRMTGSVTVVVRDGVAVAEVLGDVPDGRLEVSLIDTDESRELGVVVRDSGGRFVQHAASTHIKE